MIAREIASICCWPPDSSPALRGAFLQDREVAEDQLHVARHGVAVVRV